MRPAHATLETFSDLQVIPIDSRRAAEIVIAEHYLHRRPSISAAYGLVTRCEIVGVVTFGIPASRHLQVGVYRDRPDLVVELNRLWVSDEMPRNSESWFVSRALRDLPSRIVVSYADTTVGHVGYIYRALSWNYAGWTDMDRKTPRYDYIPEKPGAHTRESSRSGVARRVRRLPKVRYWTTTGTPSERRFLASVCGWPALDWKTCPPPTHHTQLSRTQQKVA